MQLLEELLPLLTNQFLKRKYFLDQRMRLLSKKPSELLFILGDNRFIHLVCNCHDHVLLLHCSLFQLFFLFKFSTDPYYASLTSSVFDAKTVLIDSLYSVYYFIQFRADTGRYLLLNLLKLLSVVRLLDGLSEEE